MLPQSFGKKKYTIYLHTEDSGYDGIFTRRVRFVILLTCSLHVCTKYFHLPILFPQSMDSRFLLLSHWWNELNIEEFGFVHPSKNSAICTALYPSPNCVRCFLRSLQLGRPSCVHDYDHEWTRVQELCLSRLVMFLSRLPSQQLEAAQDSVKNLWDSLALEVKYEKKLRLSSVNIQRK